MFRATSFNVTTALLVVAALFVVYTRIKGWLDSNVPLIFYGVMAFYTNMLDGGLAPSVVYSGLGLGLMLRFEFMNNTFLHIFQAFEFIVLAVIIYNCVEIILQ